MVYLLPKNIHGHGMGASFRAYSYPFYRTAVVLVSGLFAIKNGGLEYSQPPSTICRRPHFQTKRLPILVKLYKH